MQYLPGVKKESGSSSEFGAKVKNSWSLTSSLH